MIIALSLVADDVHVGLNHSPVLLQLIFGLLIEIG